jgi:acetylornithine deacetylase/succinyl-diaminopimelate desuccinylase-like protein
MASEGEGPAELLARLIRFDTSNPPGNERECIAYIERLLSEAGLETRLCAIEEDRPNLIARLPGRGAAPPLMLYGHVDVVPAEPSEWRHAPFEGAIEDGYVWGRGALDMKGGVAMMICSLLRARAEGLQPAGDILFAALSDEERGSEVGARYLVEERADLFDGVRYAIGEFGGYTMNLAGGRFYPIQVAEKQTCQVKVTLRGAGGHGSLPARGGATAKLGRLLARLDERRLPAHLTPVVQRMLEDMAGSLPAAAGSAARQLVSAAGHLPGPATAALRQLVRPELVDLLLEHAGDSAALLDPLLHNTAVATIVRAGAKENVIPSEASVLIDGRLLPGQRPEDFLRELGELVGPEAELEVVAYDENDPAVDYGLFPLLADILTDLDPGGTPIPMLLPAVTDGRLFARIGIQTYGFVPLQLDPSFRFTQTIHAADERVPVEALEFGTRAIAHLLARYEG